MIYAIFFGLFGVFLGGLVLCKFKNTCKVKHRNEDCKTPYRKRQQPHSNGYDELPSTSQVNDEELMNQIDTELLDPIAKYHDNNLPIIEESEDELEVIVTSNRDLNNFTM